MSSRRIDAYFKNEDQAQDVMTKIQTLGGTECVIENLESDDDDGLTPMIAYAGSGTEMGVGINANASLNVPVRRLIDLNDEIDERRAMFSFAIDEDKEAESIEIIYNGGGWLH